MAEWERMSEDERITRVGKARYEGVSSPKLERELKVSKGTISRYWKRWQENRNATA